MLTQQERMYCIVYSWVVGLTSCACLFEAQIHGAQIACCVLQLEHVFVCCMDGFSCLIISIARALSSTAFMADSGEFEKRAGLLKPVKPVQVFVSLASTMLGSERVFKSVYCSIYLLELGSSSASSFLSSSTQHTACYLLPL